MGYIIRTLYCYFRRSFKWSYSIGIPSNETECCFYSKFRRNSPSVRSRSISEIFVHLLHRKDYSLHVLQLDASGEVVAAGSLDSFDIHLWSVQTGQLLDRLSGHEGPISS